MAQTIPTNPDVVIIGAGAAGLSAARTLIAQGKSVVIVEGSGRIGGRAYTENYTFGVPYDHGCFNVMGPKKFALLDMAREWDFDLLYMKGATPRTCSLATARRQRLKADSMMSHGAR